MRDRSGKVKGEFGYTAAHIRGMILSRGKVGNVSRLMLELHNGPEPVPALSFSTVVDSSLAVLRDVDQQVSLERQTTLDWFIEDLSNGTTTKVVLGSRRIGFKGTDRTDALVCQGFVGAFGTLERGEYLPPNLTGVGLRKAAALSRTLSRRGRSGIIFNATYVEEQVTAQVTDRVSNNVRQLLAPKYRATGSVIGTLERISVHRGLTYHLYDSLSGRAITCRADNGQIDVVKSALGRRVSASGTVVRNSAGQAIRIDSPQLTVLPTEDDLPSIGALIGLDPDFTGGFSTGEWIEQLYDA